MHRTKLENGKELSVTAYTLLCEKNGTSRLEFDAQGDDEKYRRAHKNEAGGHDQVHRTLQEIRVPCGDCAHSCDELKAIDLKLFKGNFAFQRCGKDGDRGPALSRDVSSCGNFILREMGRSQNQKITVKRLKLCRCKGAVAHGD